MFRYGTLLWIILSTTLFGASLAAAGGAVEVRDGDLIFQISQSTQSQAIQQATGSVYSHVGVVFFRAGKPTVLEASRTVRFTPLADWIAQGERQHYVLKRLIDSDRSLTTDGVAALKAAAAPFVGKKYDLVFSWSDQEMYCSELVWKIYDRALGIRIGTLQRIGDFSLDSPVVRINLHERYGTAVPLDETVISPVAMFDSPLLTTVFSSP